MLDEREDRIEEKYVVACVKNDELHKKLEMESEVNMNQLENIEKLELIICNEMVSKANFDQCYFENKMMEIKIKDEMVDLKIHQQVKESYADLQCTVEWGMVPIADHIGILLDVFIIHVYIHIQCDANSKCTFELGGSL
jgi:hypothetical protein